MASNWKKRIACPSNIIRRARPRSSPAMCTLTSASKAVKHYDEEAENCLRQLELNTSSFNTDHSHKSVAPVSSAASTMGSSSTDILGTFCHLMHYVVHLRRENRHLRKQVLCLNEMRQIEKLQNELLRSACTCETGAAAVSILLDTKKNELGGNRDRDPHWRHSMPVDGIVESEHCPGSSSKSISASLAAIATDAPTNSSDAAPSVTTSSGNKGVAKSKIRTAVQEFREGKNEKRSLPGGRVAIRGHPSAPVTIRAQGKAAGAIEQQAVSSKNQFLAPPAMITRNRATRPLSASSSGSAEGASAIGQGNGRIAPSSWLSRSFLSPSSWRQSGNGKMTSSTLSNDRAIRNGAEEALAEGGDEKGLFLMHRSIGEDSTSYSPRSMSSAGSWSLTKSLHAQIPSSESQEPSLGRNGLSATSITDSDSVTPMKTTFALSSRYSDSDQDQSVFTEVQLPDYRRSNDDRNRAQETEPCEKRKSGSWRYSDMSHPFGAGDQDGPTVQKENSGILSRFGLKRPSVLAKKRMTKTASISEDATQAKSKLITPLVSKSMYSEKVGFEDGQPNAGLFSEGQPDKWKLARKAFLKKRKRKISESDSLASSDVSGKSYTTIELPDINYCRKSSYPQSVPIITTVDIDYLSKNVSKGYLRKMQEWKHERSEKQSNASESNPSDGRKEEGGLMRRMSLRGQQIKRRWLKPKCADEPTNGTRLGTDDGRQNTVIEDEASQREHGYSVKSEWSVSDSDISRKAALQEVSPVQEGLKEIGETRGQQQQRSSEQQKLRSVTFLEQLSPAEAIVSSTTSQQLTISNDSVFASLDRDLNCRRSNGFPSTKPSECTAQMQHRQYKQQQQEEEKQKQATDVVEQLLLLQERNSLLICTLKEKTQEYELITERLCDLEKEVQTLRERHRFDSNLEHLYNAVLEPNFVPASFVQEIEKQVENLDHNIRVAKSEAYEIQQMALETHANDQATTMRYLNQIDSLQKANFHLLSKTLSELSREEYPEIRRQLELLPTYEALYSFTISLLRKIKHIRTKLLEKNISVSKLDLELLQTQSSLLLAHAQIERQKMEIRLLKAKYDSSSGGDSDRRMCSVQSVRRTHSYHGQDILARAVNAELSFYLPFKLHGFHTVKREQGDSNQSLCHGDEVLELEFAKLFDTVNRLSGHYDEIQPPLQSIDGKCEENRSAKSKRPKSTISDTFYRQCHLSTSPVEFGARWRKGGAKKREESFSKPQQQPRPISCYVPDKDTDVKRIAEEISCGRYFMSTSAGDTLAGNNMVKEPPSYLKKAPPPLKLGNVGQVKAMAAAFSAAGADEVTSAPTTPSAPPLLQRRVVVKETKLTKSTGHPAIKPASHCREFSRVEINTSRIPVRNEVSQNQHPPAMYASKISSRLKPESAYETLNFVCRESDFVSPPPSITQLSPSTSGSVGIMEKSMSPDAETVSSMDSTAGSSWSISKRNEAKKLQFFYGASLKQLQPRCPYPEVPTSPVPPSSPAPQTPPTPVPPTPTLPNAGSRFPEFSHLQDIADSAAHKIRGGKKGNEKARQGSTDSAIPVRMPEKNAKKTSWFQKLRHKN